MPDDHRCPRCDTAVSAEQAARGECPSCLLKLALDASLDDSGPPLEAMPPSEREALKAGSTIGPYRIVRELGEGGMGVVYLAEQSEPLQRRVALKVIKLGMDSRMVVRRFEVERQALALMDHPSIARVYEAGETASGRPYFVMEYIEGRPINEYCDSQRLSTAQRLELFVRTCEGLQHAHQRGIIHRDIKPSNILVTEQDGRAQPKIIDFGVAKAVEKRLTEHSALTDLGVLLGTPEYMSPEQADLAPLDVDTRTDVYSLGVVLYELLTGALPFDPRALRAAAFDEIRRQIREVRPSKPSTRLSQMGVRASESALSRRTDVSTLTRKLSGDLDVITMKALEKDRGLRYGSPSELAADVLRHLNNEPVLARPPSAMYQLRKLISRHRLPAALAGLFLLTLLAFAVWMSLLYRRAAAAEAVAAREAATSKRVSEFLIRVFEISDPGEARGNTATARELLDNAAARIEGELADQPEIQSTMTDTMGRVYASLGLYERAIELGRQALAEREARMGPDDPAVAESLTHLAAALLSQGQHDESEQLARRAVAILERAYGPDAIEIAPALETLQLVFWRQGRPEEALEFVLRVKDIRERVLGAEHLDYAQSLNNLGNVYMALGRYDEAEPVLEQSLSIRERLLGPDHPTVGVTVNNLAELYRRQARYDEAIDLFLRLQQIDAKNYEPNHPQRAYAFNNLGLVYKRLKRYDEAVAQYNEALRIREASLPPSHPMIAWTLDNLGLALRAQGKLDEAGRAFERALAIARESVGPEHPDTAIVMANLSLLRSDQGRFDEAEALLRQTLAIDEKVLGRQHPETANTLHNLGQLFEDTGRLEQAREHFRQALEIYEATLGPEHPDTQDTRERYEAVRKQLGE